MEKDRREKKEAHRSGVLHEVVDPPVGRGPQPADEEEEEEDAEEEKDLRGPVAGPPLKDEEADEEEEEPEDGGVEVGRPPEPDRREAHRDGGHFAGRRRRPPGDPAGPVPNEVGHGLPDPVPAQLARGVGDRVDEVAADTQNAIARDDARPLRRSSRRDQPHLDAAGAVRQGHDAVVGPRGEHVRDRRDRDRETDESDRVEPPAQGTLLLRRGVPRRRGGHPGEIRHPAVNGKG